MHYAVDMYVCMYVCNVMYVCIPAATANKMSKTSVENLKQPQNKPYGRTEAVPRLVLKSHALKHGSSLMLVCVCVSPAELQRCDQTKCACMYLRVRAYT